MSEGRATPRTPGWYPDPYGSDSIRWFDGTMWTTHAVATKTPNPDAVVEQNFDPRSDPQKRLDEWADQFAWWDTAIPRGNEQPFGGGGGWQGVYVNRGSRFALRLGDRLVHPAVTLTVILVLTSALLAWGDAQRRVWFIVAGFIVVVLAGVYGIRRQRERRHWDRVGKES